MFRGAISRWRAEVLGLSKRRRNMQRRSATLYAYSPTLLPPPPDWPQNVNVSGFWRLAETSVWVPDPALRQFLENGPPPVHVGFGSMPHSDPRALTALVVAALAKSGRRGILSTGGGALVPLTGADHVYFIETAPHTALFRLVSACVHHGGAGTTGASLRAGRPTIVCPFFGDQPFWGRVVHSLGAGPQPIDRRQLSVERLADSIISAHQPDVQRHAGLIGEKLRAEDGVNAALSFLDGLGLTRAPDGHR